MNEDLVKSTNQLFDLSEKVIYDYLCYYLDVTPEELFGEDLKIDQIPILEMDYKNSVKMYLDIVPHDYLPDVPVVLITNSDDFFTSCLDAFKYSVDQVFNTIVHHSLTEKGAQKMLMSSFHLEFDPDNYTFKPIYVYPNKRQRTKLQESKESLERFYNDNVESGRWVSLDEDVKQAWSAKYEQINVFLEQIPCDNETASETEKEVNLTLHNKKRIGIIFSTIT